MEEKHTRRRTGKRSPHKKQVCDRPSWEDYFWHLVEKNKLVAFCSFREGRQYITLGEQKGKAWFVNKTLKGPACYIDEMFIKLPGNRMWVSLRKVSGRRRISEPWPPTIEFLCRIERKIAERRKARYGYMKKMDTLYNRRMHNREARKLKSLLLARQGRKCFYCGKTYPSQQLTIDHQKPVSRGGKTSLENCVLACRICNSKKGSRVLPYQKKFNR